MNKQDKRVEVCKNFNKAQVIAKLGELQETANIFESYWRQSKKSNKYFLQNQTLAIGIVWIGFSISPGHEETDLLLEELGVEDQDPGIDESPYINNFVLTHLGEPICINEYA